MKKFIKISIPVIIIAIILYGIYYCFFDIQQIKGHELINEVTSPSGKYTILAYLNNYGKEKDHVRLQPENDSMDPIIVTDVQIIGKVVGLIRRF